MRKVEVEDEKDEDGAETGYVSPYRSIVLLIKVNAIFDPIRWLGKQRLVGA